MQREWHLVDRADVLRGHHRVLLDVAEVSDLRLHLGIERTVGTAEQDVGLDAEPGQFLHAVLRGLGLRFTRGRDVRDERQVQVEDVLAAAVPAELADRLQERQALDVADGTADLADRDVVAFGAGEDAALDLVGDVRDHLDGSA